MKLRPATNADASAVRTLIFEVLAEFQLAAEHKGVDADLDDLEANYLSRGGLFDVLEDESGRIIGTVGLYPHGHGVVELRKMYLLPASRGQGLGRRLLEHVLARAKELGFHRMELETNSKLTGAIALYQGYGFTPIPLQSCVARCDQAFALDL